MAAIAKFLGRGVPTFGPDADVIKQLALFCVLAFWCRWF
jgi:hypothetical protein